ncbi:hypothetical protein [Companilactobacillus sp. DQM5]|uniref:hypothetical protein n=1 Tax=Companilactobacillus sp. DQM5 TaxID=3463359 RepID=UPI004057DFA1
MKLLLTKGFIIPEALVGLTITIMSCLVLVISFQNMNQFSDKQKDKVNAHLSFIEMNDSDIKSLKINNEVYQLIEKNNKYFIRNINRGSVFEIKKR